MKNYFPFILGLLFLTHVQAQDSTDSLLIEDDELTEAEIAEYMQFLDSIEQSYIFQTGLITLESGIGTINVPDGFKYLDAAQSQQVLTELWGNPSYDVMTMGMILRDGQAIMSDSGYVFNLQYDEIGFVEDDDADDIDYDELLITMQKESFEENKSRAVMGYDPIEIVGWAAEPYYDDQRKILHWAKELKFGDEEVNTLNYNIRILGRKGVLVMNAVGTMPNLPTVQGDMSNVLDIVSFNEGYRYSDFDPDIDDVAAWSIGGLVAGKVLAKAGVFAFLLKFWKILAVAVAGFFSTFWKRFRSKKTKKKLRLRQLIDTTGEIHFLSGRCWIS